LTRSHSFLVPLAASIAGCSIVLNLPVGGAVSSYPVVEGQTQMTVGATAALSVNRSLLSRGDIPIIEGSLVHGVTDDLAMTINVDSTGAGPGLRMLLRRERLETVAFEGSFVGGSIQTEPDVRHSIFGVTGRVILSSPQGAFAAAGGGLYSRIPRMRLDAAVLNLTMGWNIDTGMISLRPQVGGAFSFNELGGPLLGQAWFWTIHTGVALSIRTPDPEPP